jgi:hypothetical protein
MKYVCGEASPLELAESVLHVPLSAGPRLKGDVAIAPLRAYGFPTSKIAAETESA